MAQLTKTADEPLAFTEVQTFFERLYPRTGGIAFDSIYSDRFTFQSIADVEGWWADDGTVIHGETTGITYSATGQLAGILTNNTGNDIDLSNGRVDVEFALHSLTGAIDSSTFFAPGVEVDFRVRQADGTVIFLGTLREIEATGIYTISVTSPGATGDERIWANGTAINMQWIFGQVTPPLSMIFEARRIQLSYTQERFRRSDGLQPPFLYPNNIIGIAVRDFGSVVHNSNYSWPTGTPTLFQSMTDFAYVAGGGGSSSTGPNDAEARLRNNGDSIVNQPTLYVVRINVTNFNTTGDVPMTLTVDVWQGIQRQAIKVSVTRTINGTGEYTFADSPDRETSVLSTQDFSFEFSTPDGMITGGDSITYTVEEVRVGFNADYAQINTNLLESYRRDGGIVPSTAGAGARTYPTDGSGTAFHELGFQATGDTTASFYSWPQSGFPDQTEEGTLGIAYTSSGGQRLAGGANALGRFENTSTISDRTIRRIEVGIIIQEDDIPILGSWPIHLEAGEGLDPVSDQRFTSGVNITPDNRNRVTVLTASDTFTLLRGRGNRLTVWIRNGQETTPNAFRYYVSYIRFTYDDDVRFLPNPVGETLLFRRNDYISRIGLSFNGGRSTGITSTARGTWGIYAGDADFTTNPTGLSVGTSPLSVGDEVNLVFNPQDRQAQDVSAVFLDWRANDTIRIIRDDGIEIGEGYIFELMETPVTNRDSGGPLLVLMTARVTQVLGNGTLDNQAFNSGSSVFDDIQVHRPSIRNINADVPTDGTCLLYTSPSPRDS